MNKKKIGWYFIFLVLACAGTFAQEIDPAKPQILTDLAQSDGQSGRIELMQATQIENLLKLQIANNRLQKGVPGYRISIFSQSGQTARQNAKDARTTFMKNFPEMEAYEEYNSPNFQILVGDFRTKSEALFEKKKIEKMFPRAFIVNEIINVPK